MVTYSTMVSSKKKSTLPKLLFQFLLSLLVRAKTNISEKENNTVKSFAPLRIHLTINTMNKKIATGSSMRSQDYMNVFLVTVNGSSIKTLAHGNASNTNQKYLLTERSFLQAKRSLAMEKFANSHAKISKTCRTELSISKQLLPMSWQ